MYLLIKDENIMKCFYKYNEKLAILSKKDNRELVYHKRYPKAKTKLTQKTVSNLFLNE